MSNNKNSSRTMHWIEDAAADLRSSALALLRQKGFAALTFTVITLAVAVNTIIFALLDGVLLQPLPYREPGRLVRVFESGEHYPKFPVSATQFLEFERESRSLESIALYTGQDLQLMHDNRSENLTAVRVSKQFFPTLGVQPVLGRNFEESEMRGSPRVVILSHSLWVNRFGSDPGIVGRTIRLNRESWTVIGVLPAGFEHIGGAYRSPLQGETVALWWPIALDLPPGGMTGWHFMNAVGRLKPGVSVAEARQDLDRLVEAVERRHPESHQGWRSLVVPLDEEVAGGSSRTVLLLIAAGGLVLLIACANVAGLCVARGLTRRREVAIRQALGARAGRLVRAWMAENFWLGAVSGLAGLALAFGGVPLLKTMLPADFPRLHAIQLSPSTALFALLAAILTALLAGVLPALRQTRLDPGEALQEEPRGASAGRTARRWRSLLVTSEIALAALLCAATLLLVRSALLLDRRDHGFAAGGVLTFSLAPPGTAYETAQAGARLYAELTSRWEQLPGVLAAGVTTNLPWTGYDENAGFDIEGRGDGMEASGEGRYQAASPGFFKALRLKLLQGRLFDRRDHSDAPPVILVNQSLAQRYFSGEETVDRVLDVFGKPRRIVGVVADIRDRPGDLQAEPAYWFPIEQQPFGLVRAVLRTNGDPLAPAPSAAAVLREVDPELPMAEVRSMSGIVDAALAERRFALWLFEAFALLALGLAAVGIYGLLAYLVEQRRKELGIRMALGASRAAVVRLVLGDGLRLCLYGVVAGLLLLPLAGMGLAGFLYGVQSADPASLSAAAVLLLAVVLTAGLIPAWSAARSHPMKALREE